MYVFLGLLLALNGRGIIFLLVLGIVFFLSLSPNQSAVHFSAQEATHGEMDQVL